MPELPEVQTVVNSLQSICGRQITAVTVRRRDILSPAGVDFASNAAARRIVSVVRRGKKIIFLLDSGNRFTIHLGMTGRLTLENPSQPLRPHTHMIFHIGKQQLRFADARRFGGVAWIGTSAADEKLGPEPLTLRPKILAERLARTHRAIKNALLDQGLIAGLGNIYVDEALFAAGIHPLIPADALGPAQVARLNRSIKTVLRRALRHRGSTLRDYRDADGNPGNFQKLHRVYQRTDQPCAICKTPIKAIRLGGRSTHFCPVCQPQ